MISSGRKMLLSASVWHLSRGSTASLMLLCDQTVDRRAQGGVDSRCYHLLSGFPATQEKAALRASDSQIKLKQKVSQLAFKSTCPSCAQP